MSDLRVLMYHRVDEIKKDYLTVNTAQLEKQLKYIKNRYNPIRLSDLIHYIDKGIPLPEKPILITFDDGYVNNLHLAYPLFQKHKIPFAIFLVSDFLGKTMMYDGHEQEFLSVEQCRSMADLAEFACHGTKHANVMDLSQPDLEIEVETCKKTLESKKINPQAAWAYTYGAFPKKDQKAFEALKNTFRRNGISAAFRIGNRLNTLPLKDKYCIQRLDIRGSESHIKFLLKLRFGKIF